MEFLYLLEGIRTPFLDQVFSLITHLGSELVFMALSVVMFWCVNKSQGLYLLSVGCFGTTVNQFLKITCRVPRPWVRDPNFTIVESARADATGYSFPSGHTQNSVCTMTCVFLSTKEKWIRAVAVALILLVPFSRMYVGVHTPQDVLVGALTSIVLIFALRKVTLEDCHKGMKMLVAAMIAMALGLLLFVEYYPFPADVDAHNLQSGVKNAYTMIGCLAGVAVVYVTERKYVDFTTNAVWWAQILKVVLGLGLVLLVKEGLRAPLEALLPVYPARAVRYFLIVLTAGLLWPMSFSRFARLGKKVEEIK